jgi:hypothetical protein
MRFWKDHPKEWGWFSRHLAAAAVLISRVGAGVTAHLDGVLDSSLGLLYMAGHGDVSRSLLPCKLASQAVYGFLLLCVQSEVGKDFRTVEHIKSHLDSAARKIQRGQYGSSPPPCYGPIYRGGGSHRYRQTSYCRFEVS